MSIRKTTIALRDDRIEELRVKAIREKTSMGELIARAVEACYFTGDSSVSASLDAYFHPDRAAVKSWLVSEADESEDFDEADID